MTELVQRLKNRFYKNEDHPYEKFEDKVAGLVRPGHVILDAGCGRSAPVLGRFKAVASRLIGVDLVDPRYVREGIEYHQADLAAIPIESGSVDLIISRSVFEHLQDPAAVYREFFRILKPGGRVVFLTANFWDYGTQIARLVPNRLHSRIVRATEGRPEEDTFPTAYRTNTRRQVQALAQEAGLTVQEFSYLNQYPNYFYFNGLLFLLGVLYERLTSRFECLRGFRGWIMVVLRK